MPPLWTSRRLLWTGVAVALVAELVVSPLLVNLAARLLIGYGVLGWIDTVLRLAAYTGASMVAASFVVRVLEQRGVVPAAARNANSVRPDDRSNDL
ncbi:hypothetical protein [Cellulomonas sp. ICMP 17802]|uniref:hypothetical protein n=1 Tax=Cellulomonas sp. ICMP 17802 TaxID=3239199 RepID=UPI00351AE7B5